MKNKYNDLIEQTFEFPQEEFVVEDNELMFHNIPLMDIIKQMKYLNFIQRGNYMTLTSKI